MKNRRCTTIIMAAVMILGTTTTAFAGVTDSALPTGENKAGLNWMFKEGKGYSQAPTSPTVVGNSVYFGAGGKVYKVNKDTGQRLKVSGSLADDFGYATIPITYVKEKNILLVPMENAQIQALDADTLKSLWITERKAGFSSICPVVYKAGYFYTGFWKTESRDGMYQCFSIDDKDTNKEDERKTAKWSQTKSGGFYWAGANVTDKFVLFTSEVGKDNSSKLYSAKPGDDYTASDKSPIIDSRDIQGNARATVVYDETADAYFFTTKGQRLYRVKMEDNGAIKKMDSIKIGGYATGTLTAYKGKIYVAGSVKDGSGAPGFIKVIDGNDTSMKILSEGTTPGYIQVGTILSKAQESSGKLYIYGAYNSKPGGISVSEITGNGTKVGNGVNLFTPPKVLSEYCLSSLVSDDNGTLYYKNDSCALMAITEGNTCYAQSAGKGTITPRTISVKNGDDVKFNFKPNAGYKLVDIKVDNASKMSQEGLTLTDVRKKYLVEGVFLGNITPGPSKVQSATYDKIKISWAKMDQATFMDIYRSTSKNGSYKKLKTLSGAATSYTDSGLYTGQPYYYKLKGGYRSGSTTAFSELSSDKGGKAVLNKTTIGAKAGKQSIKLSWKQVSGASGYVIERATSKSGKYAAVKTVSKGSTKTWTNTKLKKGKTYYYKAKAYRTVKGKKVYSVYSNVCNKKAI
ncbi:MAG: hypothetical protein RSD88_07065 [Anaerovoracaceae bacterium]